MRYSHAILEPNIAQLRSALEALSVEDGLIQKIDELISDSARIQLSWLESGEPLIHYEDLLNHDLEILERVLLDECQMPVARERFREVVLSSRFEQLTNGRKRGQEEVTEHTRKGIAGDWRNYFTDRVKRAFKVRYGGLLVAIGYEQDLNW
jgi:lipopolysaccharide transport system ATP-binding protein